MANSNGLALYGKYAARRDELGYTDYKVAKLAGIARGIISEWKNGRSTPNADNRMKIAKAIKKPITFLM